MTRKTSVETYREIIMNGLLSKMRFETYDLLFEHGPLTANQLMELAKYLNPKKTHQALESLGRRLSELRDLGTVEELGEILCPVTKRKVILWDVTDNVPKKTKGKVVKKKCEHCGGTGYER